MRKLLALFLVLLLSVNLMCGEPGASGDFDNDQPDQDAYTITGPVG